MYFFLLLFSLSVFSQDVIDPQVHTKKEAPFPGETPPKKDSPVEEVVKDAKPVPEEKVVNKTDSSEARRTDSFGTVMVGFQYLALWIPAKKTISYTHIFSEKWSTEFEYSWSSISLPPLIGVDIGKITEKRFSLLFRNYTGNSFHWMFGPYYNRFHGDVGGDVLYGAIDTSVASFESEHIGVSLGMGNRWQLSNGITLGVDWLRFNIPVAETKNDNKVAGNIADEDDASDIKKITRAVNRYPNILLFGLHLGYTF